MLPSMAIPRPPATEYEVDRLSFDVGPVSVEIIPSSAGRFAHFLLYRAALSSSPRMLIGSGSTHDVASCVVQATSAARRVGW